LLLLVVTGVPSVAATHLGKSDPENLGDREQRSQKPMSSHE